MRRYLVYRPIRGVQTLSVEAHSVAEAEKLVNANDPSVEGVDAEIQWNGKARARLEPKDPTWMHKMQKANQRANRE